VSLPLLNQLDIGSMRGLAALCSAYGAQIVHAHRGIALTLALGTARLGAGFGLVVNRGVTFHPGLVSRVAFRSARLHRIICACEAVRQAILDTSKVPTSKLVVISPSVDTARFDPARVDHIKVRAELGLSLDAPLIVQVGVRHWKGWRELLAAFARVREQHPTAHLLLVGCRSRSQVQGAKRVAGELGLTRWFTATLARLDIPDVLAGATVAVDASWAGTGVSGPIREAMALGRPVVATAVGGNAELVEHSVDGLLVPSRDVETLAAAISRLLRDRTLADSLGRAAQAKIRDQFDTTRRVERLEACYRQVLSELAPLP
jgi:L-malate glycosyltransferase